MAADVLGGGMDDHSRPMLEGLDDQRGRRVVDDQRHAELAANRRHLGNREDMKFRVGQRLGIVSPRLAIGSAAVDLHAALGPAAAARAQ